MTAPVRLTAKAEEDLIALWEAIAGESPNAADRALDRIDDVFRLLAEHPEAGRRRDDIRPGFRLFPERPWLVFYRIVDSGVEVVRVVDGRRDLETLF